MYLWEVKDSCRASHLSLFLPCALALPWLLLTTCLAPSTSIVLTTCWLGPDATGLTAATLSVLAVCLVSLPLSLSFLAGHAGHAGHAEQTEQAEQQLASLSHSQRTQPGDKTVITPTAYRYHSSTARCSRSALSLSLCLPICAFHRPPL